MAKLSKRAKLIAEKIDPQKTYEAVEALTLLKEVSSVKFDETVDVCINLGVDAVSYTHLTLPDE